MISKLFDRGNDPKSILSAISKSLSLIEYDTDGNILTANKKFCELTGYGLSEIAGKPHNFFLNKDDAQNVFHRDLWNKLRHGESQICEVRYLAKGGEDIWVRAAYSPIETAQGKVSKIVEVVTDMTETKRKAALDASRFDAVSREQGVIEFTNDGRVVRANDNFLNLMGYRLDEIEGRHHSMFVDPAFTQTAEYREFWTKLGRGEPIAQEFKRIGKGGKEVWIEASYNPIFDLDGKVSGIVKFAIDISARVESVNEVGKALEHLAKGDLFQKIDKPLTPALETLRTNFNYSAEMLKKAMWQVGGTALAIQRSTGEIQASADDLSRRTEQQAASLEETAAALDQITATVRTTADGAKHACEVVGGTKIGAEHSGEVVGRAVAAMHSIEKSSGQIGQIISVIDEIAFQTNLLALNAGVEAARAGDAGRGFAVVASEVRALAQRSAEAAKEIKSLILASRGQVEEGVDLVEQTGKALAKIVVQVAEINDIVVNIASSAQEQSVALAQVNSAINQMDQMTQQNAAMVEQSTAATHGLSSEISELFNLIAGFRVSADNGMAKSSAAPSPARQPQKPVQALKVVGSGGAARKPKTDHQDWEEF